MAFKEELVAVVKGDIKDFSQKMNQVSSKLKDTSGLVDKYGNKIESANQTAVQSTQKAAGKFKDLGATLTKLGAYAAATYGVIQSGKAVIESASSVSDRWKITISGLNNGLQALFRSVATMNFNNFFSNIQEAIRLGRELEKMRDELEDSTRSLTIAEAKYGSQIAQLREFASTETNALNERIDAMRQAIDLQKELNLLRISNARQAYDIAIKAMMGETKLGQGQIENLISYYNKDKELRDKAARYNAARRVAEGRFLQKGDVEIAASLAGELGNMEKLNQALAAQPEAVKAYADILEKYGNAADKTIDDLVQKTAEMYRVIETGSMAIKGLNRQLNGLTPTVKPVQQQPRDASFNSMTTRFLLPTNVIREQIPLIEKYRVAWEQFSDTVSRIDITSQFRDFHKVTLELSKELEYLSEDVLVGLAESIGAAFAGGTFNQGWNKFLVQVADWAQKLGAILVAAGLSLEAFQKQIAVNPGAAVAYGLALIAAASAVKTAVNKRPGASGSQVGGSTSSGDFDLSGFRNLRSDFVVQVNGTLKGSGKDLYAVIQNENNRRAL